MAFRCTACSRRAPGALTARTARITSHCNATIRQPARQLRNMGQPRAAPTPETETLETLFFILYSLFCCLYKIFLDTARNRRPRKSPHSKRMEGWAVNRTSAMDLPTHNWPYWKIRERLWIFIRIFISISYFLRSWASCNSKKHQE